MEFDQFVRSLMPLTKIYLILCLITGMINQLKLINPIYLVIVVPNHLHYIWTYITSLVFVPKLSISNIMLLIFFYYTNNPLEKSFITKYGEYLYMILYIFVLNLIILVIFSWNGYVIMKEAFVVSLVYIFCKRNPNQKFQILFILMLKGYQFIFFYVFMVCIEHRFIYGISGVLVGHSYIYFKEILPITHRKFFLDTPRWCNKLGSWFLRVMKVEEQNGRRREMREGEGRRNNFDGGNDGNGGFRAFQGRGVNFQ